MEQNNRGEIAWRKSSRLDYFRTPGWFVCGERCALPGNRRQKIARQYRLLPLCIAAFTRRQFERAFGSSFSLGHSSSYHFPTVPVRPTSGKVCYVITLWLTFVIVVMTMSHNAWWPAPCESACFDPLYCDAALTQKDASGNMEIDSEQREIIPVWKRPEMLG